MPCDADALRKQQGFLGDEMTNEELKEILDKHKRWLGKSKGWRKKDRADLHRTNLRGADLREVTLRKANLMGADLRGADLYRADLIEANLNLADLIGADLTGVDLTGADLTGTDLTGADLREASLRGVDLRAARLRVADLRGADLRGTNLYEADLYGADLRVTNLYKADMRKVNLYEADLGGANLYEANLYGANLYGANLYEANLKGAYNIPSIPYTCPDFGIFKGWKKASGKIVCLEIPEDAKRLSATGRKCRCNKAKVLNITELNGDPCDLIEVSSDWDKNFIYKVGELVSVPDFDEDRWNECSTGIHFFINRQEAVEYN